MRNIGLIGKARSGKDSAAAHLVATLSYTRLAFADPLKELALRVNPIVAAYGAPAQRPGPADWYTRLGDVVNSIGWERAKDEYPEVRRILQHIGQAQREIDEDFWLRELLRKVKAAADWRMPVVVTDVRYRNEAESLRRVGFQLVRIIRPPAPLTAEQIARGPKPVPAAAQHSSETELDDFAADVEIVNGGSLDALYAAISAAVDV